ncbi:hypothetical protein GJ496_002320 [Pomphorhynchus laevis]|nr:hypothetical protein GJ496_002320 [Pomphorhynchus laevis]
MNTQIPQSNCSDSNTTLYLGSERQYTLPEHFRCHPGINSIRDAGILSNTETSSKKSITPILNADNVNETDKFETAEVSATNRSNFSNQNTREQQRI